MLMLTYNASRPARPEPWNKGKLVRPKPPFKLHEIWAIRIRLDIEHRVRELAMFNLAIDSKLRGCDLVRLKVSDVMHGHHAVSRALAQLRGFAADFADPEKFFLCKSEPRLWITAEFPL